MRDTTNDAEAVVRAAILQTDPVTRMRNALRLSETLRELALRRLRARYPDRSTLQLVELLIGAPLIPAQPAEHPRPT